jgi:hypothetical protein
MWEPHVGSIAIEAEQKGRDGYEHSSNEIEDQVEGHWDDLQTRYTQFIFGEQAIDGKTKSYAQPWSCVLVCYILSTNIIHLVKRRVESMRTL